MHHVDTLNRYPFAARQSGRTFLGLLIIFLLVGLVMFAGLRLFPVYMEDMKIRATFDGVQEELSGEGANKRQIQEAILKRFDVDSVRIIHVRDVEVKKVETGYEVSVAYSNSVPFIANINFAVDFNHRMTVVR
ncbi:MAG: DUF4845 domain-containing protein [Pseudomonadota bacterium]